MLRTTQTTPTHTAPNLLKGSCNRIAKASCAPRRDPRLSQTSEGGFCMTLWLDPRAYVMKLPAPTGPQATVIDRLRVQFFYP